ncbi:MAG TPA: hypothetical protein VKY54_12270 [Kiloniellales bacterium]|nr:hypothetical protein [Kiloniellales bacterium]
MKAFVAAVVVAIVLAVGAHFGLQSLEMSSANVFSGSNVRLGS